MLEMGFKGLPCPKCILKTINPMEDALLEKKTGTALLLEPCGTGLRPRPLQRRGCRLSLRDLAPASCTRNKAGRGWGFPAQEAPQASTAPRSQQRARVGRGHTPLHPAGASCPACSWFCLHAGLAEVGTPSLGTLSSLPRRDLGVRKATEPAEWVQAPM